MSVINLTLSTYILIWCFVCNSPPFATAALRARGPHRLGRGIAMVAPRHRPPRPGLTAWRPLLAAAARGCIAIYRALTRPDHATSSLRGIAGKDADSCCPPCLLAGDAVVCTATAAGEARLPPYTAVITLLGRAEPFPVEGDEQDGRVRMEEIAGPRAVGMRWSLADHRPPWVLGEPTMLSSPDGGPPAHPSGLTTLTGRPWT